MKINLIISNKAAAKRVGALVLLLGISILSILFLTSFTSHQNHPEETGSPVSTAQDLPIFDTHVHYKEPAWTLYTPKEVLDLFRRSGVTKALVSSSPDDGTRMLYNEDPDMIVPFLRPYHDDVTSGNWYGKRSILTYLQERLELPIYKGLGEFHIHDAIDVESSVIQETIRMAMEDNLYIHVHTGHEAIEAIFAYEPDIKILWAHAGMSDPPEVVSGMFDEYENLWVDISIREYDIAPNGRLDPEWKALFLKHPDRITVGTDTWVNSRWEQYETIIEFDRGWLDQLPEEIARQIAYENAERLFD